MPTHLSGQTETCSLHAGPAGKAYQHGTTKAEQKTVCNRDTVYMKKLNPLPMWVCLHNACCQNIATGATNLPKTSYIRGVQLVDQQWLATIPILPLITFLDHYGQHPYDPANFHFVVPGTARLHIEISPIANLCPGANRTCRALSLHAEASVQANGELWDAMTHRSIPTVPKTYLTTMKHRQGGPTGPEITGLPNPGCRGNGKECSQQWLGDCHTAVCMWCTEVNYDANGQARRPTFVPRATRSLLPYDTCTKECYARGLRSPPPRDSLPQNNQDRRVAHHPSLYDCKLIPKDRCTAPPESGRELPLPPKDKTSISNNPSVPPQQRWYVASGGPLSKDHPFQNMINDLHIPLLAVDERPYTPLMMSFTFGLAMFTQPGSSWNHPPDEFSGFHPMYRDYCTHILSTAYADIGYHLRQWQQGYYTPYELKQLLRQVAIGISMEYYRCLFSLTIFRTTGRFRLIKNHYAEALKVIPNDAITAELTRIFMWETPQAEQQRDPTWAPTTIDMRLAPSPRGYLADTPPPYMWGNYHTPLTTADGKHITNVVARDVVYVHLPDRDYLPMQVVGARDTQGTMMLATVAQADTSGNISDWSVWKCRRAILTSTTQYRAYADTAPAPTGQVWLWLFAAGGGGY